MRRIGVLVSGGGTNLQALLEAQKAGAFAGKIVCVISSAEGVYALERAKAAGVEALALPRKNFSSAADYSDALLELLEERQVEMVVLAGFLSVLAGALLHRFQNRILNVHPSLIPSFCGKGMYGLHVHEAALACGVKVTGATVHLVSDVVDGGRILLQKAVQVLPEDTPESLQRRVMEEAEWELLPRAVAMLCRGDIGEWDQEESDYV